MNGHGRMSAVLLLCAVAAAFSSQATHATVLEKNRKIAGAVVQYLVVLPNDYDATKVYPAVLAFPPADQGIGSVIDGIQANFRDQAEQRGYIVVMPAAPSEHLLFEEGDIIFPQFLTKILADYKIQGNKFHAAGADNGGFSAFHIAASYPQYFWSVTALPGFLQDPTSAEMRGLAKVCIYMYAGERDRDGLETEQKEAELFRSHGSVVNFSEEKGQGHVLNTLRGPGAARLFDQFEQARKGCGK